MPIPRRDPETAEVFRDFMTTEKITDVNVLNEKLIPTPEEIKKSVPLTDKAAETTKNGRRALQDILDRKDKRLFVVVGPCSVHDLRATEEYAERLSVLQKEVSDTLVLVMRVYFAKPRTSIGWKGFINDPFLDDSFRIDEGLRLARQLLLDIGNLGVPAATEALDSITPQYIDDLLSWNAIGARTTESQSHREMASGLSTPVGFKNGTDGNIEIAINAIRSCSQSHHFLGINSKGQCIVLETKGNRYGHIVLRGGPRPNYDSVSVNICEKGLQEAKLPVNLVIDCSHGNSLKDASLQPLVFENCVNQIVEGNRSIVGLMIESHLHFGNQTLLKDPRQLQYGVSITDSCIDWETTEKCIRMASERLRGILPAR